MNVPSVARMLGVRDPKVIGKAEELMRLSKIKVANSLGAGEVCKAAVCLELACSMSSSIQSPSRDLFIRQGCATKKVYQHTFSLLQKALGVTAAPPTLAQIAVKFGCEHLAKAAGALLMLFKSRHEEQVASWSSGAAPAGGGPAAPAAVDYTAPAAAVAALHMVSSTMTWKKGQAKPDVRKMLKGLDIAKPHFEGLVECIKDLCAADLGLADDQAGDEGVDKENQGEDEAAGGQVRGRKKGGREKRKRAAQRDGGGDDDDEISDGGVGEGAEQGEGEVLGDIAGQAQRHGRGGAGKRRRTTKTVRYADDSDEDGDDDDDGDDAWEVLGRAGQEEHEEGGRRQSRRGRSSRSRKA